MSTITTLSTDEFDALIQRVEEAIQFEFVLTPEDGQLLLSALLILADLQTKLENNSVTLHKLRKLLGIVA